MHRCNYFQSWLQMSYVNVWQGFPSDCFSWLYCCFPHWIFVLNQLYLIKDVTLVIGSIATHHAKADKAERSMILTWTVAVSLQGQQVAILYSPCGKQEKAIQRIQAYTEKACCHCRSIWWSARWMVQDCIPSNLQGQIRR